MPEEPEIQTENLHEAIQEEMERQGGRLIKAVAVTTALLAAIAAVAALRAGGSANEALMLQTEATRLQAKASDQWSYYQAKGVKAAIYATQAAADLGQAQATIAQARSFAPYEAAYAIEAGNYALNLDQNGNPASNADWPAAQEAYQAAARLGSYSPEMFRELAIVDEHGATEAALAP